MDNNFISGIIGGSFGIILSHPIDTMRIMIQTNKPIQLKMLYKGLYPPLFGIGLEKSIVFGTFYSLQESKYTESLSTFNKGMISGLISTLVVSPVEQIKIQLQTQKYNSTTSYFKNIINTNNYSQLYKGWSATLFREVPGYGLYFICYENIKRENDNLFRTFCNGSLSGIFAWSFIYPADYIKTTVQSLNCSYKEAITGIIKKSNGNPMGFYRGCSYALLRCIPLHGGVFMGYEFTKKLLDE